MKPSDGWQRLREMGAARAAAGRRARLGRPGLRGRADLVLATVLGGLTLAGLLAGLGGAAFERANGLTDPPVAEPLRDRRILSDFRRETAAFADAVMTPDGLLAARTDGKLMLYDPASEVIREGILPPDADLTGALDILSRGCGGAAYCAAPDRLFAVTDRGGLAGSVGGDGTRWQVLLADAAWTGADGLPVEQADVRLWAAEDRGQWVLVWAGPSKGLGLFDQQSGRWTTVPGGAEPTQLLPGDGLFWLGSASGVERVIPGESGPARESVTAAGGEIVDMTREGAGNSVLALRRAACSGGGTGCMGVLRAGAEGAALALLQETEIWPQLSGQSLRHATMQGRRLVALGAAGVYRYDLTARAWQQVEAAAVDAYAAIDDGGTVYFSAGRRFAELRDGGVTREFQLDEALTQILPGSGAGRVFGLDRRGRVIDLGGALPRVLSHDDAGAPAGSTFTSGAAQGDLVLLAGPSGILLHDTALRRYAFTGWDSLAIRPLDTRNLLARADAGALWLADAGRGDLFLVTTGGDWPGRVPMLAAAASFGQKIVALHTAAGTATVTLADGTAHQVGSFGAQGVLGPPLDMRLSPDAVTAIGEDLVFAEGRAIRVYQPSTRGWYYLTDLPEAVADLAFSDKLFAVGQSGRLYQMEVPDGAWQAVSAGGAPAEMGSRALSDARASGGRILLGGAGQVIGYAPQSRSFGGVWSGGRGEVAIIGANAGVPLWVSGGQLLYGDQALSQGGEAVLAAVSVAAGTAYLAETDGRRHLVEPGSGACLFRGVAPPAGDLTDAAALPDGTVLALTDRGAGLHDATNRRWIGLDEPGLVAGQGELAEIAGHLLRRDGDALRYIALADLPRPGSCDARSGPLAWQQAGESRSVVLDRTANRAFLLAPDGSLRIWSGTDSVILPAASRGPAWNDLSMVEKAGDKLTFLADDRLWNYDLKRRDWAAQPFGGISGAVAEIDLAPASGPRPMTAWTADGRAYGADWSGSDPQFRALERPQLPQVPIDPAGLLDLALVRTGSGEQAFVALGQDRLVLAGDADRAAATIFDLPARAADWQLGADPDLSRLFLVGGALDAPQEILRIPEGKGGPLARQGWSYSPASDRQWLIAEGDTLWRIDAALQLWRCDMQAGGRAPDDCDFAAAAPLPLRKDQLRGAVPFGAGSLILTPEGLQALGADARPLGAVDGISGGPQAQLFTADGHILLWEGQGRALWRILGDPARAERLTPAALAILPDDPKGLFVETAEGLSVLDEGGALVQPALPDGSGPLAAATFAAGALFGLDAEGRIVAQGGPGTAGLPALAADTRAVLPGPMPLAPGSAAEGLSGWWSQAADGGLRFDWIGRCAPDLPRPLAAGAEGIEARSGAVALTGPEQPCARSFAPGVALPPGQRLISVEEAKGGIRLASASSAVIFDPATGKTSPAAAPTPHAFTPSRRQTELEGLIASVGNASFLAPPRFSAASNGGRVQITGPATPLAVKGTMRFAATDPFAASGVSWNRADRQVTIGQGQGALQLAPEAAIRDGRFLPDHPGRAAYLGSDAFGWINPHGLWRIANGSYQPVSPGPQPFVSGLHRGIFLTDSGGIDAASGAVTAPQPVEILREGALQLQQNIRPKRVSAAIAIDGALRDATAPAGFAFDQRLGAARIADRPAVLTPLGIIGAESLDLAIAAPEATVRLDLEGDDLMAQSHAGQWHRLGPRGWQPSPPPHDSHVLARDAARIWKRRAGRAEIVAADPARPWGAVGQGLNFDADRIVAFGADATGLVAVTGIGTETATGFGGFAGAAAPVAPDPGAQRFLTQEVVPGRAVVAAETPGGWQIWDGTARSWRAPQAGEEPWKERLALRTDGLEIWFRAGKAEPFVTVTDPAGNSDLRPFGWAEGEQMPFDHVRAIHAEAGALLAGTDFGLRRFAAAGGGLRHEALFAHNGAPDAPPAVAALGRPVAATGEIQAAAGRACLTLDSIAANPRPCAAPAATDRLAVLQTPFWHWEKGRSGPRGSYLLSDGSHLPIGPSLTDRLPHDRLADRATCDGVTAEIWQGGGIVTRIAGTVPTRLDPVTEARQLHCQSGAAVLDAAGTTLDAGFYLLAGGTALQQDGGGWQALPAADLAAAVAERAAGAIAWESPRLRIRIQEAGAEAELNRISGSWQGLGWQGGRMPVDQTQALLRNGAELSVATPAGVMPARLSGGGLGLDLANLVAATTDDPSAFADCRPELAETRDGIEQAIAADPSRPMVLRCASGQVLSGRWSASADLGALAPHPDPAFPDRVLIDRPDLWQWVLNGDGSGLSIAFRGEPLALSGGRLTIDAFSGIAAVLGDDIELVAANGWWRQAGGDLALTAARRSPQPQLDPREVRRLWPDAGAAGPLLCIEADRMLTLDDTGRLRDAEACRRFVGDDGLWRWWQGPAGPEATATALNGPMTQRSLIAGRFADLQATGAPYPLADGGLALPNPVGALILREGRPAAILSGAGRGLIAAGRDGAPALIERGAAVSLQGGAAQICPGLAALIASLPEGARLRRLALDPQGDLQLWNDTEAGGVVQHLVACDSTGPGSDWLVRLPVEDRPRFRALSGLGTFPSPLLAMQADGGQLALAGGPQARRQLPLAAPDPALALLTTPDGRATLLVTRRDILRVNTDPALTLLFAPPEPEAPPPEQPALPAEPPPQQAEPAPTPDATAQPVPKAVVLPAGQSARTVRLQRILRQLGHYKGKLDGIAGPQTHDAIRAWQKANNLTPTGELDEAQLRLLGIEGQS